MLLSKAQCRREEVICRRSVGDSTPPPWVLLPLPAPLNMASSTSASKCQLGTVRSFHNTESEMKVTQEASSRGKTWSNWGRAKRLLPVSSKFWHMPSNRRNNTEDKSFMTAKKRSKASRKQAEAQSPQEYVCPPTTNSSQPGCPSPSNGLAGGANGGNANLGLGANH